MSFAVHARPADPSPVSGAVEEDSPKIPDVSIVESSAELLYGLIHQRYILTAKGMQQMVDMYGLGHFGYCPRVYCHSHPVLPCGRSDLPGLDTVKLFCPNCMDCYAPPSSRFHSVDGMLSSCPSALLVLTNNLQAPSSELPFPTLSCRAVAIWPRRPSLQNACWLRFRRETDQTSMPHQTSMMVQRKRHQPSRARN